MPNQTDKITPAMATDRTNISKAWLYWLTRVSKLIGEKLDIILGASGKIPKINAAGELEASDLDADLLVSTSDTATTDNAVVRMDGTDGTTIQESLATISDAGSVNIPSGQTYNIDGVEHSHTLDGLSDVATTDEERGDLLYRAAAGWVNLHHGTDGQVLTTKGNGADPEWSDAGSASVAGNDTEVQFNDGGVLGAIPGFSVIKATGLVTVAGNLSVETAPVADTHVVRKGDLVTYWPIGYWPAGYWP